MGYRVQAIARLAVMLTTSIAALAGYAVDAEVAWQVAADVLALGAGVWAWWKNAPITPEAVDAQKYLEDLKRGDMESVAALVVRDIVTSKIQTGSIQKNAVNAEMLESGTVEAQTMKKEDCNE